MKANFQADPPIVAIKPVGNAKGEAEISILIENDDGSPADDLDVTVYVDRGAVRNRTGVWGKLAYTRTTAGVARVWFTARRELVSSITPGSATLAILAGPRGDPTSLHQIQVQVIGEPMLLTITAAPSTVRPGELVTVTATVQDAIGQDAIDGTLVRFTASPEGSLTDQVLETRRGRCTTFLLTGNTAPATYTIAARTDDISATARIVTRHSSQTVA